MIQFGKGLEDIWGAIEATADFIVIGPPQTIGSVACVEASERTDCHCTIAVSVRSAVRL